MQWETPYGTFREDHAAPEAWELLGVKLTEDRKIDVSAPLPPGVENVVYDWAHERWLRGEDD